MNFLDIPKLAYGCVYIEEKTPLVKGQELQCFADWSYMSSPPKKIRDSLEELKEKVIDEDLKGLSGVFSQKDDRRNKLEQLEIEELRGLVDDSYSDWCNSSQNEAFARQIARTAYGFNKNREFPYSIWIEKFKDFSMVVKEIKNLENYKDEIPGIQ